MPLNGTVMLAVGKAGSSGEKEGVLFYCRPETPAVHICASTCIAQLIRRNRGMGGTLWLIAETQCWTAENQYCQLFHLHEVAKRHCLETQVGSPSPVPSEE